MVEGGGQLARAAAYIRERSTRRSPAFDKFICRTLKAPPDKTTESDTIRHVPDVASEGKRFSKAVGSLQPRLDVEMFPSQPKAQRLSKERSESIPKFAEPVCDMSDVGGQERRTVQLVEAVEADRCSAERLEEIKEISDELVMPALEEAEQPPNLMEQQPEPLAVSKSETGARLHSPIPSTALMLRVPLPATLLQTKSIDRPSLGLDWLLLKPPDGVGFEWCLHDTVNSKPFPSVEQHSPEPLVVVIPPVPKPVSTQAYSCCIQNATVAAKRRIVDVVSTNVDIGATKHLLLTKAAFALPNPSSARLLRMVDLHNSSLELVVQTLKPPNRVAYSRLLYEAVNTLNKRADSVTHLGWNARHPVVPCVPRFCNPCFVLRVVDARRRAVLVYLLLPLDSFNSRLLSRLTVSM